MGTLVFCIVISILILCFVFGKDCELGIGGFFSAIILGLMVGGLAGLVFAVIPTVIINNNLNCYSLESRSNYDLIKQTSDDKTYFVEETTHNNILYKFEYEILGESRNIIANDNTLIQYSNSEKPSVTVEHYEPNIWLKMFTFCFSEDYYYITLNNNNNLYMTLE